MMDEFNYSEHLTLFQSITQLSYEDIYSHRNARKCIQMYSPLGTQRCEDKMNTQARANQFDVPQCGE